MSKEVKVSNLKPGMNNISLKVRVIEAGEPKVIQTRKGPRTISNAVVGDDTGRVKLTLWGDKAGSISEGSAIEIEGAWTTAYKGEVQLNIGSRGSITEISSEEVPEANEIPEKSPKAPEGYRQPRRGTGSYTRGGYRRSKRW